MEDNMKEIHAIYASTAPPSLLGRGPSPMPEGISKNPDKKPEQPSSKALLEEKGQGYPDNLAETGRSYSPFRSIPNGLATYPAHYLQNPKRQHLPLHLCANNYNQ